MDSYLQIAETVLRSTKRPMTAKSILKEAFKADLVPHRLYGQTQHKTLQARLSIDILNKCKKSTFFRNGPGTFFLREFLSDTEIPAEFRKEVFARRRTRSLVRGPILVANRPSVEALFSRNQRLTATEVCSRITFEELFRYERSTEKSIPKSAVWVFSIVRKGANILSFRCGNYRDYRDSFAQKRSVGFSAVVTEDSRNLFNMEDFGISDCGMNAVAADLNLSSSGGVPSEEGFSQELSSFFLSHDRGSPCLIAVLEVKAPDWFEPVNPSLSINDLRWLKCDVAPNDIDDFDPWSKGVLKSYLALKESDARSSKSY
ncbi:winged helix-turn-helix domain-containing protein [Roseovarius nanhaiticus]|uniref:winged helix-turn-helix domain-containing protein n=1 Tax=Roseovarius nanhaiticus TaxID=573024 RepID=UPI00249158A9|nr:winged helix-turn-helix domain-containing protein [Roseovarius nanhaiticus]